MALPKDELWEYSAETSQSPSRDFLAIQLMLVAPFASRRWSITVPNSIWVGSVNRSPANDSLMFFAKTAMWASSEIIGAANLVISSSLTPVRATSSETVVPKRISACISLGERDGGSETGLGFKAFNRSSVISR